MERLPPISLFLFSLRLVLGDRAISWLRVELRPSSFPFALTQIGTQSRGQPQFAWFWEFRPRI
jgi:hypothetical protein